MSELKVAVVGGGAAGFFAAIHAKQTAPESSVVIFEQSKKVLSKVKVSGGGRCNVTNGTESLKELVEGYPRGGKLLKKLFKQFNNRDTISWFEKKGVKLKCESDGRVFPVSDSSQTIIDCLMKEIDQSKISIVQNKVLSITPKDSGYLLKGKIIADHFHKVIIATGGSPKLQGFEWLQRLGHEIASPVPSLFTFNMPKHPITKMMGVVASNASVTILGTKLQASGPLLITHWGLSGPAVLKLSSKAARTLSDKNYSFDIGVNWVNLKNEQEVRTELETLILKRPKKFLANQKPFELSERLWLYLLDNSGLSHQKPWGELGKKGINKLVACLCQDQYHIQGKTTFKEEFVTCGGISLESINHNTLESKSNPGLFFAGEVLDIDGITGGYNFQAAWTTAFVAANHLTSSN